MLGINCPDEIVTLPAEITELFGIPVIQLDFGIEFGAVLSSESFFRGFFGVKLTFLVSADTGDIYTWGKVRFTHMFTSTMFSN